MRIHTHKRMYIHIHTRIGAESKCSKSPRTHPASIPGGGGGKEREDTRHSRIKEFQESSYITPRTRSPTSIGSPRRLPQEQFVHSAGALPGYPSQLYSEFRDSTGPLPSYGGGGTTSPARGTPRVSYADYAESPQMALVVASLDAGDRPQSAPQVPQKLAY